MGRKSGQIALAAGLAGGAESILVPELPVNLKDVVKRIKAGITRGKLHSIIVVAEGCCSAIELGKQIEKMSRHEIRVTVLGHTQRGGTPTAADRILASRLASKAVEIFINGEANQMVGIQGKEIVGIDLQAVVEGKKEFNQDIYELARILSI